MSPNQIIQTGRTERSTDITYSIRWTTHGYGKSIKGPFRTLGEAECAMADMDPSWGPRIVKTTFVTTVVSTEELL